MRGLRSQMEALSFAVDALSKRLNIGPVAGGGASGAGAGAGAGASAPAAAGTVEPIMTSAQRQFNLQNYPAARDEFLRALNQNPTGDQRIEILFWLAESYSKLNDLENAKKYYTQLIKENPSHIKAWASLERLANLQLAQGDKDNALVMLQQIVNDYPKYPDIGRVKATIEQIQQGAQPSAATPTPGPTTPPPGRQPSQP
jgi:TolA-binding protein